MARLGFMGAAVVSLFGATASAQAPGQGDVAAAQALFNAAQTAMVKGDWATACPKFEESLAADKSVSTLLNIAKCHEHDNKLAVAWAEYQEALGLNQYTRVPERKKKLDEFTRKAILALEPRLPKLRIVVKDPPTGAAVLRDGKTTVAGEALPIDPGGHEIEVSAPGKRSEKRHVDAVEGKTMDLEFSLVAEAAAQAPGPVAGPPPAAQPIAVPPSAAPSMAPHDQESTTRTWPWIVGVAGLAMAGGAVAFRVDQSSVESTLHSTCGQDNQRCPPGFDVGAENARKNRDAGLFIGLAAGGGAALLIATIGLVTKPSKPKTALVPSPWIGPRAGGASVVGSF